MRTVRKIAFLRSVGIQRADPYIQRAVRELAAEGIEAGLFHTSGSAGDGDFPGRRERLDRGVTPRELGRGRRLGRGRGGVHLAAVRERAA